MERREFELSSNLSISALNLELNRSFSASFQVAAAQMAFLSHSFFPLQTHLSALIVHWKGRAAAKSENESMQMLHEQNIKN